MDSSGRRRKSGGHHVDNESIRSKSSLDIRHADHEGNATGGTQTPSRRKRIWDSFRKGARKLRHSRSREKLNKKNRNEAQFQSQPNISTTSTTDSPLVRARTVTPIPRPESMATQEIDVFMTAAAEQQQDKSHDKQDSFRQERSFSDKSNGGDKDSMVDRESEVDSGIAVVENGDVLQRRRQSIYRSHPFFQLEVHLKEGHDLVVRDSCGTSDPYVKFKVGNKQLYKSRTVYRNLNPKWDEKFTIPIEDVFKPLSIRVYDYDRGMSDDPMGGHELDLITLDLNQPQELKLKLVEKAGRVKEEYMGFINLTCTLVPKTQDEKDQYFRKTLKLGETAKKLKMQIWSSVVTIVLVEGRDLLPMDDNGFSDPYVKFRLGNEKYKSKFKPKTLSPKWLEQFDLHMFDDQTSHLEISVWDHDSGGKDDFMGRAVIDLSQLEREKTHSLDQQLEDGAGYIRILLTISGTSGSETVSDLANYTPNPREKEAILTKYSGVNSFRNFRDIGWLQVKVIKAAGLAAADIGGKSDPFCVLELVNARLQTQTEYKTLSPDWGKIFTFNVKDIHSVLEVTVYDEDRDKKSEFLGKVAIPLLRINNGQRKWFALKDKKLLCRTKGAIQLELEMVYNTIKAAIRTFNPREEKYMQPDPKFKISIMKRNIDRVSKIAQAGMESAKFIQSCFAWESTGRSATAFAVFLIIVWNFELYMLPATLLIIFLKNLLVVQIVGNLMKEKDEAEYFDEEDEEEEEDKEKEEKKSFKEKLQQIQDVCLTVQEAMDSIASLGERVKNTFNWTVPWLSWLAMVLLTVGGIVLYYIPIRYIIMLWGINKFTKKLRAPNAIPNNEVLDYLSRVPSDKELVMYRELRPDPTVTSGRKKRS